MTTRKKSETYSLCKDVKKVAIAELKVIVSVDETGYLEVWFKTNENINDKEHSMANFPLHIIEYLRKHTETIYKELHEKISSTQVKPTLH